MKTALTELIEELKSLSNQSSTSTALDRRIKGAYVNAVQKAKKLLEKEKRQIMNAYKSGNTTGENILSDEYYNQTFLSDENKL